MRKRIWKKEGSPAWRKALEKSASRMARSLMRMADADEERIKFALARYMKNKPKERRGEIREMIIKAHSRRWEMYKDFEGEIKHLEGQWQAMCEGSIKRFIDKGAEAMAARTKVPPAEVKKLMNGFETMNNSMQLALKKLAIMRKMAPKGKDPWFKETEKTVRERIASSADLVSLLKQELRNRGEEVD